MNFTKCPKCGHVRTPQDTGPAECCPACGLYFAKWLKQAAAQPAVEEEPAEAAWHEALRERLEHIPERLDALTLYGRALLWLLLLVWGVRIAGMDYRVGEMGGSFMHAILLPIHEAGHIFFIPLGHFMTILGGSLFQLLLPLIAAATLLWQNRDHFGAALGVWWCGVSLIDLAVYIYDAKDPQITLLGGQTGAEGPHDWIYLLGVFGKVQQSQAYGTATYWLGVVVMLAGLAWAARVLWRWHGQPGWR